MIGIFVDIYSPAFQSNGISKLLREPLQCECNPGRYESFQIPHPEAKSPNALTQLGGTPPSEPTPSPEPPLILSLSFPSCCDSPPVLTALLGGNGGVPIDDVVVGVAGPLLCADSAPVLKLAIPPLRSRAVDPLDDVCNPVGDIPGGRRATVDPVAAAARPVPVSLPVPASADGPDPVCMWGL